MIPGRFCRFCKIDFEEHGESSKRSWRSQAHFHGSVGEMGLAVFLCICPSKLAMGCQGPTQLGNLHPVATIFNTTILLSQPLWQTPVYFRHRAC